MLTAFVCSACDGEIAPEEVELVKNMAAGSDLFGNIPVEDRLNEYVSDINRDGAAFINNYFRLLSGTPLDAVQALNIARIAIEMIEADGQILYPEMKFFKQMRPCLPVDDEAVLEALPGREMFLEQDIVAQGFDFGAPVQFGRINL